jgi:hypothetical protein
VLRFGKESEPTLTAGGEAFASGLSPNGRLAGANDQPAFYGSPLVAWTSALGAETYAVQWSKTAVPFVPQTDPGQRRARDDDAEHVRGAAAPARHLVLPRARLRLLTPLGAQAMSWSDPQKIVATRPVFVVVGGGTPDAPKTRTLSSVSAGLSLKVPSSFRLGSRSTTANGAALRPLGPASARLRLTARDLATGAALFVQTSPDRTSSSHSAWVAKPSRRQSTPPGRVGALHCSQISLPAGAGVRCTLTVRSSGTRQRGRAADAASTAT